MLEFVQALLLSGPQGVTLAYCLTFLALGTVVGSFLRRPLPEAMAFGFLILSGSAGLAFVLAQGWHIPTSLFGLPVAVITTIMVYVLRKTAFQDGVAFEGSRLRFAAAVMLPVLGLLIANLVQPDGSADIASHQGWDPLYLDGAFRQGTLFDPRASNLGDGLLVSISYLRDMIGLTALGKWFGFANTYAIYNATATAASIAAVAVLVYAFQRNLLAQAFYVALFLILLRTDGVFRLFVGYNYSEAILYLGGACIIYLLVRSPDPLTGLRRAAALSVFLVVSRHYGAFYAAVLIALGFIFDRLAGARGGGRAYVVFGLCLTAFTLQELLYLINPPSDFYPAGKLLSRNLGASDALAKLAQLTNDLGFTARGQWPATGIGWPSLYWIFVVVFLWRAISSRPDQRKDALWSLSPILVVVLPLALQLLTGYRTTADYNKFFAIALYLNGWYAAFGVMKLTDGTAVSARLSELRPRIARMWPALALAVVIVAAAGWLMRGKLPGNKLFAMGPTGYVEYAFQTYRDTNTDLNIANRLRETLGAELSHVVNKPILYLHYEPGVSLRLFIGGNLFKDFDFWSPPVLDIIPQVKSFAELVDRLGRPNVYISFGNGMAYRSLHPKADIGKFTAEIADPLGTGWGKQMVSYQYGRFVITN